MRGAITTICLFTVAAVGTLLYFINAADQEHERREQEWRNFSIQHHCFVRVWPTFWNGETTWECTTGNGIGDYFQVVRKP